MQRQRLTKGALSVLSAHLILALGSVVMILPFFWMLSTSLKSYPETLALPIKWLPASPQWHNYLDAWKAQAYFGRYFLNSFTVAFATLIGDVIFSILAAYAFARMRFLGRSLLFMLLLATMMVPGEVLLVPNFLTLRQLGWYNTLYALIIPWTVSVFAIFLLRQHFLQIPNELQEAAYLDGAGHTRFLVQVVVPLSRPPIATIALLKFIGSWNAFLWPLVATDKPQLRTVPIGLMALMNEQGPRYHIWMAAAALALIPVVGLFLIAQRQFLESVARSGLKG